MLLLGDAAMANQHTCCALPQLDLFKFIQLESYASGCLPAVFWSQALGSPPLPRSLCGSGEVADNTLSSEGAPNHGEAAGKMGRSWGSASVTSTWLSSKEGGPQLLEFSRNSLSFC